MAPEEKKKKKKVWNIERKEKRDGQTIGRRWTVVTGLRLFGNYITRSSKSERDSGPNEDNILWYNGLNKALSCDPEIRIPEAKFLARVQNWASAETEYCYEGLDGNKNSLL